jgi:[citrate (pro-3S)-lyase] ligase
MATFSGIELRQIPLHIARCRHEWEQFLRSRGLEPIPSPEYVVGLYNSDDKLVGCGAIDGDVMKCVAVDPTYEGEGLIAMLVSGLYRYAQEKGCLNLMVYTKPEYRTTFESMAFRFVGSAPKAILLESNPRGILTYTNYLKSIRRKGRNGAIVMNANPFTLGHRYLIETAAKQVDNLYIILVADNPYTQYDYTTRLAMAKAACYDLTNVVICEGSKYAVSASTFPTYFIKKRELATDTHIALDLDIFIRHIAPALGIDTRFVGSEPTDMLTNRYNELMHQILPPKNINVVEIPRKEVDSKAISATEFRKSINTDNYGSALELIPVVNQPIFIAEAAVKSLQNELDLTPKPGLIDRHDNGSHTDMDYQLMCKSINAIREGFERLGTLGSTQNNLKYSDISGIGIETERKMFQATNGVNTHKGAIFSIGLTIVAASKILSNSQSMPKSEQLSKEISQIAEMFPASDMTHGAMVKQKYGIKGALEQAKEGYAELFNIYLPFLRDNKDDENVHFKLLLLIMSRLQDSNVYFRCGEDGYKYMKSEAERILHNFSIEQLISANKEFTSRRISPGGSADMLALTLFIDRITK